MPERDADLPPPSWLVRLVAALRTLLPRAFVGSIEINVFQGGVTNVVLRQSYKGSDLTG